MLNLIARRSFGKITRKLPIPDITLKECDPELYNIIKLEEKR